jgi:hypothetical protein
MRRLASDEHYTRGEGGHGHLPSYFIERTSLSLSRARSGKNLQLLLQIG